MPLIPYVLVILIKSRLRFVSSCFFIDFLQVYKSLELNGSFRLALDVFRLQVSKEDASGSKM